MDAIGWREQADAPDRQPVSCSRALARWARGEAKDLLSAFDDFEPADMDLDAYAALCAIGGDA